MLHIYFGGLKDERLGRVGYLAYWLLLTAFLMTVVLLIGFGVGIADNPNSGDIREAQPRARESFDGIFVLAIWAAGLTALFAELNISAKRVRHMGLPGWPVTLAMGAVIALAAVSVSQTLGFGVAFLAWLALVLVPGGLAGQGLSKD